MARGSVKRNASGRWGARVDAGRKPDGTRDQRYKTFDTKREADAFVAQTLATANRGESAHYARMLFKDYLLLHWLPFYQTRHKESSFLSRETDVRVHIIPALGQYPLGKLTPALVQRLYSKLEQSLAPATVWGIASTINAALNRAVRWEMLPRNPAAGAQKPAPERRKPTIWTPAQFRQFLAAEDDPEWRCYWLLLAATGMRKGEALALQWGDVDWQEGSIRIERTLSQSAGGKFIVTATKTDSTHRVALPDALLTLLREAQQRQEQRLRTKAIVMPKRGVENPRPNLRTATQPFNTIFTHANGKPIHPSSVDRRWRRNLGISGLPRIRIHDLRHGNATMGLIAGVPLKVISERLGHANIRITADTYSHVTRALDHEAANAIGAILFGNEVLDDGARAAD